MSEKERDLEANGEDVREVLRRALPEAAPRSRKPQRGELYVEALVDASGDAAGFAVFAVDENLDDEDHPALLTVEDIDNDARDLLEAMCEALNRAAAAPPSGVDREAEGWHYLPELPPEGRVVLLRLAAEADPAIRQEWVLADVRYGLGRWFVGTEPLAERERFGWRPVAWCDLPGPPPLPEAKP